MSSKQLQLAHNAFQACDAIDAAKARGEKHFDVIPPAGAPYTDDEFRLAVLAQLKLRGRVERKYTS